MLKPKTDRNDYQQNFKYQPVLRAAKQIQKPGILKKKSPRLIPDTQEN